MNNKTFDELVSQFQADHGNVNLNDVMVEFSRFICNEDVESYNLQWYRDEFQQIISRRITEKVNKNDEITDDEVNFITDYLHRQIEIKGQEYIIVPVEEINENTVKDIIAEAIDKISSDEIEEGNVPKYYLNYIKEESDILEDYFYVIIDEMKEEAEDEESLNNTETSNPITSTEMENPILKEIIKVGRIDSSRSKITPEQVDYYDEVVRELLQLKIDEYDPNTMTIQDFITETVNKLYDCKLLPWKYVNQYEESIEEEDCASYPYLESEIKRFLGIDEMEEQGYDD